MWKTSKFGVWGSLGIIHLWDPPPIWPVEVVALWALRKKNNFFILGESAPIWGSYGVLKFPKLLFLSRLRQSRYRKLERVETCKLAALYNSKGTTKRRKKFWGRGPHTVQGPPPKSDQCGILAFRYKLGRPFAPTLTTDGKVFMACYSAYNRM